MRRRRPGRPGGRARAGFLRGTRVTQRLYQKDAFLREFQARVLDLAPAAAGSPESPSTGQLFDLRLDRTAFYPAGGGQPADRGTIQGLPVLDVREEGGAPVHTVAGPAAEAAPQGAEVRCALDWARRFDHMQQHSGQHLLSRAFLQAADAPTRSFHLGESLCTIDIGMAPPDPARIREAESLVNAVIWEDRPVRVSEARAEEGSELAREAGAAGLKLKPGDPVRTIRVEGFDDTPCGGTHVSSTGQVGIVAVTAWEAYKKMTRVTFVCGGRVARRLREAGDVVAACVAGLSAPEAEVPAALQRLLADREEAVRRTRELEGVLAREEARREAGSAPTLGGWRVMARDFDGSRRSLDSIRELMKAFVAEPSRLAVLTVSQGGTATLMAARSAGEGPALGPAVSRLAGRAGGRGGGSATEARAGGIPAEKAPGLARELLERLTSGGGDRG